MYVAATSSYEDAQSPASFGLVLTSDYQESVVPICQILAQAVPWVSHCTSEQLVLHEMAHEKIVLCTWKLMNVITMYGILMNAITS